MKKTMMVILMAMILMGSGIGVRAQEATFEDTRGHWAEANISKLVAKGLVNGFPDGTFKPGKKITAEQFVKLTIVALGKEVEPNPSNWSKPYIDMAKALNLIDATESFHGLSWNADITREQMADIIVKAVELTETINVTATDSQFQLSINDHAIIDAKLLPAIKKSYSAGLITGYPDGNFNPKGYLTRAEAMTIFVRQLEPEKRVTYTPPVVMTDANLTDILKDEASRKKAGLLMPTVEDWKFYSNGWSEMYTTLKDDETGTSKKVSYQFNAEETEALKQIIIKVAPKLIEGDCINFGLWPKTATKYELIVSVETNRGLGFHSHFSVMLTNNYDSDWTWHDSFVDEFDYIIEMATLRPLNFDPNSAYSRDIQIKSTKGGMIKDEYDVRLYNQLVLFVEALVGEDRSEAVVEYLMDETIVQGLTNYANLDNQPEKLEETAHVEGIRIDHTSGSLGDMYIMSNVHK